MKRNYKNRETARNISKKLLTLGLAAMMVLGCAGCAVSSTTITQEVDSTEEPEEIVYEAMLYDNQGNNFLNFEGNEFTISPNKVKQYGWNTDGVWTSYYETSSVMTIEIDGNYIQSCGSTVVFKDKRLEMLEIPSELDTVDSENTEGYTVTEDRQSVNTYFGLTNWWYDKKEEGQHGEKIVLIQSQDGYNIGAFVGDDITWKVASSLPKTTKIMIDDYPVYIHRCNFTIIDSALMNAQIETD